MNLPNLMPFQELPFNGDIFIESEFLQLKERFNVVNAVETGTCLGSTTMFLQKNFDLVVTIEVNNEFMEIAKKRAIGDNIRFYPGSSSEMLAGLIQINRIGHNTIFFLDAHWGPSCPLKQELQIIAKAGIKPVIAIHDFKVPGNDILGYDSDPSGHPFSFEWLKSEFDAIYGVDQYKYHYNSTAESAGAKRGIIYVYPLQPQTAEVSVQPKPLPAITLYQNFYFDSNPTRMAELNKVLDWNISNPLIDRICLIVNENDTPDPEFEKKTNSDKVEVIFVQSRPTYRELFQLINKNIKSGAEISILANSDIFMTQTSVTYIRQHIKSPICFALSPWDLLPDGSYRQGKINVGTTVVVPKDDSQDAWVFKGAIKHIPDCDFCLGKPGCDNAIAERIQKAGYVVCNPSHDIRPVHFHNSNIRNYNTSTVDSGAINPDRIAKPYLILPPITIAMIPFVQDVISEPKNWIAEIDNLKSAKGESQFGEDAIIEHIFNYIGSPQKFYVDLGAGAYDGSTMSNTRSLRNKGWIGFGVDMNSTEPGVIREFITPDNVVDLLKRMNTPVNFDFLNLDIDSSDFWVLKNILATYSPRLICTEFNGTLPPEESMVLPYEPGYVWDKTNKYGYSYLAGKKLLEENGYKIIYNLHNVNIFAVKKELVKGIPVVINVSRDMYHPVNNDVKWESY